MKRVLLIVWMLALLVGTSVSQVRESNHVVLVVLENHSYSSVIGSKEMPYLNMLASKYGLATQYYADAHPSIGNYFRLTTGQILTNDDSQTPATFPVAADNIVRHLLLAGKSWKSYAEGLPSVGYTGGNTGLYAVRHNPFAYFTDVQNSNAQKLNLVPFAEFATDIAKNQLPDFSYVVPNLDHDAHDGTLEQADAWLKENIAPLLQNSSFQENGLLIITFDESNGKDLTHGGGHIATLVIGPNAKEGYKSGTFYQHKNLLRTVLEALGTSSALGAAGTAPAMTDMFVDSSASDAQLKTAALTTTGVTISSPTNGATVSSPVQFVASATSNNASYPITAMRIYVDNVSKYTTNAASLNTSLSLSTGSHYVSIVAWDSRGQSYTKSISINVSAATAGGVTISSPLSGASVSSPVQVVASAKANTGKTITSMRIYLDSVSVFATNSATINTSLTVAGGSHSLVVQAWDNGGTVYKSAETINVNAPSGTLSVNPTTLSFGSVSVGTSASQTVIVTAGAAPVTIQQASLSGQGFSLSGPTLPMTISVGQTASFTVKFAPSTAGTVSGGLTFISNASNSTITVPLSGAGTSIAPLPHSSTLTWSASTSTGVVGYNVYRATLSGGPYSKITTSPVTGTTFTDSSVVAGTSYNYVTTAVSNSGLESGYSNSVSATIPQP